MEFFVILIMLAAAGIFIASIRNAGRGSRLQQGMQPMDDSNTLLQQQHQALHAQHLQMHQTAHQQHMQAHHQAHQAAMDASTHAPSGGCDVGGHHHHH